MKLSYLKSDSILSIIIISVIILFICSSLKHILFQSTGWDLAVFDQVVYLISQGKTPISSFFNSHLLGDHAAFIFYPLALFYKVYPSVYWLFLVQAIALSISAFPLYLLAKQANIKDDLALTIVGVYLLYPLIFNVNLFDFHAEVIALPLIFWAVLTARLKHFIQFIIAIILILSCKAVLSLTVATMGIWLLLFEKRKKYGFFALFVGVFWFIITTQFIIPQFSENGVAAVGRYSFLGDSVTEIITNLVLQPNIILSRLFTIANLEYIILVFIPVVWLLSPRYSTPLICAIPTLTLNLLTDYQPQKDLIHQYSLPILPFLLLSAIATLAANKSLIRQPKYIITWSLIAFLALAKYGYFTSRYLESLDTWKATNEAISKISTKGNVLTSNYIAPHLSQRAMIKLAENGAESFDFEQFDYILLNQRYPGRESSPELIETIKQKVGQNANFNLTYEKDDIYLYTQKNTQ